MAREVTRRQLLGQAGTAAAGLAGLGVVGCSGHPASANTPAKSSSAASADGRVVPDAKAVKGYRSFVTRPDLNPPVIKLARKVQGAEARYIFLNAPVSGPRRGGAMILDQDGDLIWMGPDVPGAHKLDFDTQLYQGKPALTWWEGVETHGWGQGVAVVADSSYRRLHTINAVGHDLKVDHHEFNVTDQGTALVTVYKTLTGVDLRPVGGPSNGVMVGGLCQEIDIATGKLVFEWNSWDHVKLDETHQPFRYGRQKFGDIANPYDYFHINSLAVAPDGDLLISSRNTWTVYKVARSSGKIVWRMNGKKSDFSMGPGTHFYWQHHVRPHGDAVLTVFDNGAAPPEEKQSRALVLHVDEKIMKVSLSRQYTHPDQRLLAAAMGSAQLLPNGNMFVGWGTNPYFSEFSADGKLLIAGEMTKGNPSYRTFAAEWTGHPTDRPAVVARHSARGANVYVSWNGATAVTSWTILAGHRGSSLAPLGSWPRSGFETAVAVRNAGPYFAVRARDAAGHVLATSPTVKIS
jgi:Arylsulfotransferase (ASST)